MSCAIDEHSAAWAPWRVRELLNEPPFAAAQARGLKLQPMVQMDLDIRPAKETDIPAVLRLYSQSGMDDGQVLGEDAAVAIFRRMTSYPMYRIYVATTGHAVVGTFALLVMDNLAHMGAPSAIVENVCVEAGRRDRGIGRLMMRFAMKIAAQSGCYKMTLSSNLARTEAHEFYRSLGFEQHGVSFRVDVA